MNVEGAENDKRTGAGTSMNAAGTAAGGIRRRKKQNATLFGLALAFVVMAALVLADQPVWGVSIGASIVVITLVRAFLPQSER